MKGSKFGQGKEEIKRRNLRTIKGGLQGEMLMGGFKAFYESLLCYCINAVVISNDRNQCQIIALKERARGRLVEESELNP
jgi:hypothetical protein